MSHVSKVPKTLASPHASLVGEFYRGITHASRPAVAICLALNVGMFLLLCHTLTPDFMIRHGDRFFSDSGGDNDLFATTDALALSRESGEVPIVVLIGGSTTRAALSKDLLAEYLRSQVSPVPKIVKLSFGLMSLWEAAAMLEQIPDGARGVVILGVTSGQFTGGSAHFTKNFNSGRIGFRSGVIDRTLANNGSTPRAVTGVYLIDNASFFLSRWQLPLKRLVKPIGQKVDSRYLGERPLSEEALTKHSQNVSDRLAAVSAEAVEESFQFLQDMIRDFRKRTSMAVLMVEAPVSSRFLRDFHWEGLFEELRGRTQRAAIHMGVDYVDLNASVDLPDAVFYDWAHVRDRDAVVRCTRLVADKVAGILHDAEWRAPRPIVKTATSSKTLR